MSASHKPKDVDDLKKYDTAVMSGQSALRALLTLNGGATVAFLAFIGHAMETHTMPVGSGRVFVSAMQLFIYGTFFAVLTYGTIFLTNSFSYMKWVRSADYLYKLTLLCGFGSLGFFLWASWRAVEGFKLANEMLVLPTK
jgi:hypothetical protein